MIEITILNTLMYAASIYEGWGYSSFRVVSYVVGHTCRFNFNRYFVFCNTGAVLEKARIYIGGVSIGIGIGVGVSSLLVDGVFTFLGYTGRWWASGAALLGDGVAGYWDFKWNTHKVFPVKINQESDVLPEQLQRIAGEQ